MSTILIAAGASGGHVYPALATAEVLRARGHTVEFAGGDRLEARLVPESGFVFHPLPVRRPPSVRIELLTPKGLRALASIGWATLRAGRLLKSVRPDVVLGMGGFAAVPVTLAAGRARLPLLLHEQNAHLSLAQRIPLRRSHVLALSFPLEEKVDHRRIELVGNPVRAAITSLTNISSDDRAAARERLGLDRSLTTLLVFGGSLGSGPLNDVVPRLPLPPDVQVLHLTGTGREDDVRRAWQASSTSVHVLGYLETMQDAYAVADVAVSRSGAATVAELAIAGLPAVLVPLPTLARGDQEANARVLERAGGAIVVMQSTDKFERSLGEAITTLLTDGTKREAMGDAARTIAQPDAALRLADVIESLIA